MNASKEKINDIITTLELNLKEIKNSVDLKIEKCLNSNLKMELTDKQETLLVKTYKQNKGVIKKYIETSNKISNLADYDKLLNFLKDFRNKLPNLIRDVSLNFSDFDTPISYFDLELYKQERDLVESFITILSKQKEHTIKISSANKR